MNSDASSFFTSEESLEDREEKYKKLKDVLREKDSIINSLKRYKSQFLEAKTKINEFSAKVLKQKSTISEKTKMLSRIFLEFNISVTQDQQISVDEVVKIAGLYAKYTTVIQNLMKIFNLTDFDQDNLILQIQNLFNEHSELSAKMDQIREAVGADDSDIVQKIAEMRNAQNQNQKIQNELAKALNLQNFDCDSVLETISNMSDLANDLSAANEEIRGMLPSKPSREDMRDAISSLIEENKSLSRENKELTACHQNICDIIGENDRDSLIGKIKDLKEEHEASQRETTMIRSALNIDSSDDPYEATSRLKDEAQQLTEDQTAIFSALNNVSSVDEAIQMINELKSKVSEEEDMLQKTSQIIGSESTKEQLFEELKQLKSSQQRILSLMKQENMNDAIQAIQKQQNENKQLLKAADASDANEAVKNINNNKEEKKKILKAVGKENVEDAIEDIKETQKANQELISATGKDNKEEAIEEIKQKQREIEDLIEATGKENAEEAIEEIQQKQKENKALIESTGKENAEEAIQEIQKQQKDNKDLISATGKQSVSEAVQEIKQKQKENNDLITASGKQNANEAIQEIKQKQKENKDLLTATGKQNVAEAIQEIKQKQQENKELLSATGKKSVEEAVEDIKQKQKENKDLLSATGKKSAEEAIKEIKTKQKEHKEMLNAAKKENAAEAVQEIKKKQKENKELIAATGKQNADDAIMDIKQKQKENKDMIAASGKQNAAEAVQNIKQTKQENRQLIAITGKSTAQEAIEEIHSQQEQNKELLETTGKSTIEEAIEEIKQKQEEHKQLLSAVGKEDATQALKEIHEKKQQNAQLMGAVGHEDIEKALEEIAQTQNLNEELKDDILDIQAQVGGSNILEAKENIQNLIQTNKENQNALKSIGKIVKVNASSSEDNSQIIDSVKNLQKAIESLKAEKQKLQTTLNISEDEDVNKSVVALQKQQRSLEAALSEAQESIQSLDERDKEIQELLQVSSQDEAEEKIKEYQEAFSEIASHLLMKDSSNVEAIEKQVKKQSKALSKLHEIFETEKQEEEGSSVSSIDSSAHNINKNNKELIARADEAQSTMKEIYSALEVTESSDALEKVQQISEQMKDVANILECDQNDPREVSRKVQELKNNYQAFIDVAGCSSDTPGVKILQQLSGILSTYSSLTSTLDTKDPKALSKKIQDMIKENTQSKEKESKVCCLVGTSSMSDAISAIDSMTKEKAQLEKAAEQIERLFDIENNVNLNQSSDDEAASSPLKVRRSRQRMQNLVSTVSQKVEDQKQENKELRSILNLAECVPYNTLRETIQSMKTKNNELSKVDKELRKILNREKESEQINPQEVEAMLKEIKEIHEIQGELKSLLGETNMVQKVDQMQQDLKELSEERDEILEQLGIEENVAGVALIRETIETLQEDNNRLKQSEAKYKKSTEELNNIIGNAKNMLLVSQDSSLIEAVNEIREQKAQVEEESKEKDKYIAKIQQALSKLGQYDDPIDAARCLKEESKQVALENKALKDRQQRNNQVLSQALSIDHDNATIEEIEEAVLALKQKLESIVTRMCSIMDLPKNNQSLSDIYIAAAQMKVNLDEQEEIRERMLAESSQKFNLELQKQQEVNDKLQAENNELEMVIQQQQEKMQVMKNDTKDHEDQLEQHEEKMKELFKKLGPGIFNINAAMRAIKLLQDENQELQKYIAKCKKAEAVCCRLETFKHDQTEKFRQVAQRLADQADHMKRTLEKTLSKAHDSNEREASIARILQNVEEDNKKLLEILADEDMTSSPQKGRIAPSYNASTLSPTSGVPQIQKQFTKLPCDSPFAVKQNAMFKKYSQTPQKPKSSSSQINSDYRARMVALDSQYVKKQKAVEKAKLDTQYTKSCGCRQFECQTLI